MKKTELKVLVELMKNSRLSDREVAKRIGISQPTATRARTKLEAERYIKEYTLIPDFAKLGFEILALTFIKIKTPLTEKELKEAQQLSLALARESQKTGPFEVILAERGVGLGYNGVFVSFHDSYPSYVKLRDWLRRFSWLDTSALESFIINLKDEVRYLPLTFSTLAVLLMKAGAREESGILK